MSLYHKAVGVVVVLLGISLCRSGASDSEPDPQDAVNAAAEAAAFGARYTCERHVKSRLKAPSTAKFEVERSSLLGVGRYRVIGYVDAENSFGAMLRSAYVCDVVVGTNETSLAFIEAR